jgi:hypothetical protein
MKIIGTGSGDRHLIDLSTDELCAITGIARYGEHGARPLSALFAVGRELEVTKSFKAVERLRSARPDLDRLAEGMRAIASLIETQAPLVERAVFPEEKATP